MRYNLMNLIPAIAVMLCVGWWLVGLLPSLESAQMYGTGLGVFVIIAALWNSILRPRTM